MSSSVFVAKSTIGGAGNGLFASIDFHPGDVVCEYTGKVLTFMQALRTEDKTYMMGGFGLNVHIDSKDCPESLGRYINDCRDEVRTNTKFVKLKAERKALVLATKEIKGMRFSLRTVNHTGGSMQHAATRNEKNFASEMSHVESILRILKKNPVEKHEALLLPDDIVFEEASTQDFVVGDVRILRRIGLGTHAEVYEVAPCQRDLGSMRLALKIEKPIKHASGFIDQEISVLGHVSDLCVPKLLGVFTKEIGGVLCRGFCMELFHDSLSSLKSQKSLTDSVSSPLRNSFIEFLAARMFDAVMHFHKHQYLHRDIKPSNFMFKITSPNSIQIALVDFGSSIPVGERNSSEFRGTGAYAPVESDPWLSKQEDDYWSTVFSIVDLCVPGGLPWRSLSARNDDTRADLVAQKQAFFQSITNNETTDLTSHIPDEVKQLIRNLLNHSHEMKNELVSFVSRVGTDCLEIHSHIDQFLCPSLMRVSLPKSLGTRATPASVLLDGSQRSIFMTESELPPASSSVLFVVPQNGDEENVVKIQSILHQAASNKHISRTPDLISLGDRICLSELSLGECDGRCQLRHLACSGITRSAILRYTSRIQKICFENFFDKCYDKQCEKLHLDSDTVRRMYVDNEVPSYRPSKRSKHS